MGSANGWRILGTFVSGIKDMGKGCLLVEAATAVRTVRTCHVIQAHIGCLEAELLANICGSVALLALSAEIETAAYHVAGKLHVFVDSVVDCFDAVGVIDGELRIPRRLN